MVESVLIRARAIGTSKDETGIDIVEKPWLDERVQHTFHWDGYGKDHKSEGKVVKATLPDQFLVDYVRAYDLVEKQEL